MARLNASPGRGLRGLLITLAVVTWALVGAGVASAAITVGTGPDPVESVATQVVASGQASDYYNLYVTEKATGGQGCGANAQADTGSTVIDQYMSPGPYSVSVNWTPQTAGSYLLCAWLQNGDTVVDSGSAAFSVRIPKLSISIGVPSTVRPHQIFQITTTAQAEAQRTLDEWLIPNTGDGCPANSQAAADATNSIAASFNDWYVDGGPSTQSYNQTFDSTGSWLACAYFQYQSSSDPPEATASAAFTVATPPPPCVVPNIEGTPPLSAVEASIRASHCSVGAVTTRYDRHVARGDVIGLTPGSGTRLASGAPVAVVVSAGRRPKHRHRRHRHHHHRRRHRRR